MSLDILLSLVPPASTQKWASLDAPFKVGIYKVRAITRNNNCEKAKVLAAWSAEVVAANLKDQSSPIKAFEVCFYPHLHSTNLTFQSSATIHKITGFLSFFSGQWIRPRLKSPSPFLKQVLFCIIFRLPFPTAGRSVTKIRTFAFEARNKIDEFMVVTMLKMDLDTLLV